MNHRQRHIDFLDHFRGIAVVAVFRFQSLGTACGRNQLPWANWIADFDASRTFLVLLPFSLGWSGVAIFFVVSGFCIHLNFRRKPDWRDFTLRRFFRIYPPYLFAVLFFSLLIPWSRVGFDLLGVASYGLIWRWFTTSTIIHFSVSAQRSGVLRSRHRFICFF